MRSEKTDKIDLNQNFLVNVTRGLDNYGWLQEYNSMAKLLLEKKNLGRQHTLLKAQLDGGKKAKLTEIENKIRDLSVKA